MNISKWYKNINCSSGISQACIDCVKRKVQFHKSIDNKAEVLCNLVMDEMKIKKKVEVINRKEYGYVDIGKDSEKDEMTEAENALVFMLVCVNGGWKIPVFHYFVKALSGQKQAELTKEILTQLSESGVNHICNF